MYIKWYKGAAAPVALVVRGSTGAAKYPFQEIDFRAILILIDILNANEI